MDVGETGWGGMKWIDLANDRDQWRAVLNTVMNIRFYKMQRILEWLSDCLLRKGTAP
jgi:hypothetical protein